MDNNMDWLSDFLDESIPLWRDDPVMFFREVLVFEPDEWQKEAAEDLAHSPKVSIKSGQGRRKDCFRGCRVPVVYHLFSVSTYSSNCADKAAAT